MYNRKNSVIILAIFFTVVICKCMSFSSKGSRFQQIQRSDTPNDESRIRLLIRYENQKLFRRTTSIKFVKATFTKLRHEDGCIGLESSIQLFNDDEISIDLPSGQGNYCLSIATESTNFLPFQKTTINSTVLSFTEHSRVFDFSDSISTQCDVDNVYYPGKTVIKCPIINLDNNSLIIFRDLKVTYFDYFSSLKIWALTALVAQIHPILVILPLANFGFYVEVSEEIPIANKESSELRKL